MDEARAVLERLERIERLQRDGALAGELLEELRGLLSEAELWAGVEGGAAGDAAVARLRSALGAERTPGSEASATRDSPPTAVSATSTP